MALTIATLLPQDGMSVSSSAAESLAGTPESSLPPSPGRKHADTELQDVRAVGGKLSTDGDGGVSSTETGVGPASETRLTSVHSAFIYSRDCHAFVLIFKCGSGCAGVLCRPQGVIEEDQEDTTATGEAGAEDTGVMVIDIDMLPWRNTVDAGAGRFMWNLWCRCGPGSAGGAEVSRWGGVRAELVVVVQMCCKTCGRNRCFSIMHPPRMCCRADRGGETG